MYLKPAFVAPNQTEIHRVIRQNAFALMITVAEGEPVMTHLPFVFEAEQGEHGTLVSHLAAANPQAAAVKAGELVTVVFRGVHGYISPAWLSERSHTAPTWNYETVECRGRLHELSDPIDSARAVGKLVNQNEHGRPNRWAMTELGKAGIARRLPHIVSFEIQIESVTAKFKMHQDELAGDIPEVCPHLRAQGDEALAETMEALNRDRLDAEQS